MIDIIAVLVIGFACGLACGLWFGWNAGIDWASAEMVKRFLKYGINKDE